MTFKSTTPRYVYADDLFYLKVVQQSIDNQYFISDEESEVTQFLLSSRYGSIGILAHNTLAGKWFSQMYVGQMVYLIYSDRVDRYVVERIDEYQAESPSDPRSKFIDLETGEELDAGEVFTKEYASGKLVFQTCIERNGNDAWGRVFIVAKLIS